jgi:hypothetical protein
MAVQETIQDRATAINTSWHKTTDSVLETAKLCAEADAKLRPGDKNKFFKELLTKPPSASLQRSDRSSICRQRM